MTEHSGIGIESARVSVKSRREQPSLFAESVALLLYILGGILTLHFTLRMPLNLPAYGAVIAGAVAVPSLLHLRHRWKIWLLLLAGLGLAGVFFRKELLRGAAIFRMELIDGINRYFGTQFYAEYIRRDEGALTVLLVFGSAFLSCLVGAAIVGWRSSTILLLAELPLGWIGVNLRDTPLLSGLVPLALSFFMVYAMRCASLGNRTRKHSRRICSPAQSQEAALKGSMSVLAMALTVSLLIGLLVPRESYTWNQPLLELGREPYLNLDKFTPDRLSGSTASMGIGGGPLGRADQLAPLGELHLRVEHTDAAVPMYLRGYVGGVYRGDRWSELEPAAFQENQALFDAFQQAGIPPAALSGAFADFLSQSEQPPSLNTMRIRRINADSRWLYLPYHVRGLPEQDAWAPEDFRTEGALRSLGRGDGYTLRAYIYPEGELLRDGAALWEQYRQSGGEGAALQEGYGAFVREWYTRLPEKGLGRLRQEYTPERIQGLSPEQQAAVVRQGLSACRYDTAPGRTPAGADFVEHFLYESRRGYCMHFASAAVLMFRAMGVPARYVEGYVVRPEDYQGHQADIYDRNAHAWPEIYLEPYGWVPVEVTPGADGALTAEPEEDASPEPPASVPPEDIPPEDTASSAETSGTDSSGAQLESQEGEGDRTPASSGAEDALPEENKGEEQTAEALPDWLSRLLLLSGCILGLLLLTGAGILLRRRLLLKRRERLFSQRNRNRAALTVYAYILRLLEEEGLRPGHLSPADFAAQAAQDPLAAAAEEGFGMEQAAALALEARFSGRHLSGERLEELTAFAERLERILYQARKPLGRLWLYWISPLISLKPSHGKDSHDSHERKRPKTAGTHWTE